MFRRIALTLTLMCLCVCVSADVGYLAIETGNNLINYTTANSVVWKDNPQFIYFYVKINAHALASDGWIYFHLPTVVSVRQIRYTASGGNWNADNTIPVRKGWLNNSHAYYVDYRYLKQRGRWLNGNLMILSLNVSGLDSPYEIPIDYRVNGIVEQLWTYTSLMRVNPYILPVVDPIADGVVDNGAIDDIDGDGDPNVRTVYAYDVNSDGDYSLSDVTHLRELIRLNPRRNLKHDFNLDGILDDEDIEMLKDEIKRRAVAAAPRMPLKLKTTTLWAKLKKRR